MDISLDRVSLREFELTNTSTPINASSTVRKLSHKEYSKRIKIEIIKKEGMDMEFDLIGVHPSLANAFRRILISEVPTMAIEKVYIYNNTSIIQDEVFAHRLGLIPLKADPRKFEWKSPSTDDAGTDKDTLQFELKVKCKKPEHVRACKDGSLVERHVYTKHIRWLPIGNQDQSWSPGPVDDDILLNKLLPGHELDMKMYAYKGIGRDHAKFSPVATAFYRLLPVIRLNRIVEGEQAERLQKCFSPGVIELEGPRHRAAVTKMVRYDNCSRNVFRHDDLKDAVAMEKIRDHFIFTVESTGAMLPDELFVQAIDVLAEKCETFLTELDAAILG